MTKTQRKKSIVVILLLAVVFFVLALIVPSQPASETIQEVMKDGVLHEANKISLFGLEVNPGLVSGFVVTGIILTICVFIRIFLIPKFSYVPSKVQVVIEMAVGYFRDLAKSNSPHRNKFLGAYVFAAGVYIFVGTLSELFGIQLITTTGISIELSAPLSDINGAIAMGFLSYFVILSGGIISNGLKGAGSALKDFSLPISMSFRLFGALLSGLLVTELVYYYINLSFVLPVIVGILFTLLHALIQAYVLTMLTALFYGEVSEPKKPKGEKK
ncbi:MAG: F0F1 ATP synthase subunit A [Erysipelotrichaceae bacterium]|uniref:F0F1 ATP synthase subunit A n=1 Tax=Floccifex sp. TaxID=2815810 RepID=UPI002A764394|nr:F0F1 ATP synthase subunit A [Floccifex sp.]MDD7281229.1 F0F1 ATP synthase subunit A [Erysipelotrichaceae bacterium]MDY2958233.1 F0F1 ATP synthase subunit A [Floccifex sp.]